MCSKLINVAAPGTIDERVLNIKEDLNLWERVENHNLCLNSAKAIGCSVVNIGTQDLLEGRVICLSLDQVWPGETMSEVLHLLVQAHLVLGLISQIVKVAFEDFCICIQSCHKHVHLLVNI